MTITTIKTPMLPESKIFMHVNKEQLPSAIEDINNYFVMTNKELKVIKDQTKDEMILRDLKTNNSCSLDISDITTLNEKAVEFKMTEKNKLLAAALS